MQVNSIAISTSDYPVCKLCGKEIVVRRPRDKSRKFCSNKCATQSSRVPLDVRFFKCIGKKLPNGCIPWSGASTSFGHGVIWISDRMIGAHRVSYNLFVGDIPEGLDVLHRCDNPPCINPCHLFLGTQIDNVADMIAKNRGAKGRDLPQTKLTEEMVREIRARYSRGGVFYRELAKEYGVHPVTIHDLIVGKSWKHVT